MGHRRSSRELAMQALFYADMEKDESKKVLDLFCTNFDPTDSVRPFFLLLVEGVIQHRLEIDEIISRHSNNWRLSRMSAVDRNVMRIAVFELLYCHDIPANVTINEAIDIGKKFGNKDSGSFINGILDSVSAELAGQKREI